LVESKKNIAIFEDFPPTRERIQEVLEQAGYSVVILATDIVKAMHCISQLEELGVQAVLIDDNLSDCDYSDEDGKWIVANIKEKAPSVATIAFSRHESGIDGADYNAPKARFMSEYDEFDGRLLEILEEIFAKQ